MLKTVTLLLLALLCIASLNTRAQDETKKEWAADQPLKWSDFQGEVERSSPFAATTYTYINYRWKVQLDDSVPPRLSFTVTCYTDLARSWVREGTQTDELLAHEQLHFDITQYYARLLLDALQTFQYTANYKNEIKEVFDQTMRARQKAQDVYDNQTEHAKNRAYQAAWQTRITQLLYSPLKPDTASAGANL